MPSVSQRLISVEVLIFNFRSFIVVEEPDEIIQDYMTVSELASQDFQPGVDIVEIFKRDWKEKLIYL